MTTHYDKQRLAIIRKLNSFLRSEVERPNSALLSKVRDRLVFEQGQANAPTLAFIKAQSLLEIEDGKTSLD